MRIALIGCGEHSGEVHGPSLARHAQERRGGGGEIQLVACCDINLARAELFCKQYGFAKAYRDYHDLLDKEEPDAAVSTMPVSLIAAAGIELLERGTPCVIEKPLGANIEESRKLLAASLKTGTTHMVSVNRRFSPLLNKAKNWAAGIGPLRFLRGAMLRVKRKEDNFPWGTGMHLIDALRHVGGDVAVFLPRKEGKPPVIPWYSASFRFTSGANGSVEILPSAGVEEEIYELFGEDYRARLAARYSGFATLQCWHKGKLVLDEANDPQQPMYMLRGEYEETGEFLNALRDGRPPYPSIAQVIQSSELCHQLHFHGKTEPVA